MSGMRSYNPEQIMLSAVVRRSSRDVSIMKEKLIFSEINNGVSSTDELPLYTEHGYEGYARDTISRWAGYHLERVWKCFSWTLGKCVVSFGLNCRAAAAAAEERPWFGSSSGACGALNCTARCDGICIDYLYKGPSLWCLMLCIKAAIRRKSCCSSSVYSWWNMMECTIYWTNYHTASGLLLLFTSFCKSVDFYDLWSLEEGELFVFRSRSVPWVDRFCLYTYLIPTVVFCAVYAAVVEILWFSEKWNASMTCRFECISFVGSEFKKKKTQTAAATKMSHWTK